MVVKDRQIDKQVKAAFIYPEICVFRSFAQVRWLEGRPIRRNVTKGITIHCSTLFCFDQLTAGEQEGSKNENKHQE